MKNGKIEVVFFLPSLEPGGTEKNVVNLVNNLDRNKYQITLLLGMKQGDFLRNIHKDIPMVALHASLSTSLFFVLAGYFMHKKPDIFVSAFPRINIIAILAKLVSGAKTNIIITEHSVFSLLPVIARSFFRRLFARIFMPTLAK